MAYLVDGNNLCGAARDRRLGMPTGEDAMIGRLARFAARRGATVTVVFDGPGGEGRRPRGDGRFTVLYSGAGHSADDRIVAIAEASASPRDLTVITSDRGLRARVREVGCRVSGCRDFSELVHRALEGAAEEKPESIDIDEWERYFSGGG